MSNIIKVVWEDTVANYSLVKEREIKKYFVEKYGTERVNVIFKAIGNVSNVDADMGAGGDLVINTEYQHSLMKQFIKDKKYDDVDWSIISRLDGRINTDIEGNATQEQRFKQITIKSLEFSNFLSFSDTKNKFDLTKYPGTLSVASDPPNYGGKTVLTVDLLLFLFFNSTTKTKTADEIFNKYTNADVVYVKGEVNIDNQDFIIERKVKRKMGRDGTYKVSTSLDFYEILAGDKIIKLNGEQRAETDGIIKDYIGTKEDFLLTILTTANNLEGLIETKPTERGHILTRFIGVDFFREKEKKGKDRYESWRAKSKSAHFTTDGLTFENKTHTENLDNIEIQIQINVTNREKKETEIIEKNSEKEKLIRTVKKIDDELYKLNEDDVKENITKLKEMIEEKEISIEVQEGKIKEPKTTFDVDLYNNKRAIQNEYRATEDLLLTEITELSSVMSDLSNTIDCALCGKVIFNDEVSATIKANKEKSEERRKELVKIQEKLTIVNQEIVDLETIKDEWSIHDKATLIVSKSKLDLQRIIDNKNKGDDLLQRFTDSKTIINENKLIETKIGVLEIKIDKLTNEVNSLNLLLGSWESDKTNLENKIQENNEIMEQLEKEEVIDRHFKLYIELFSKNGISKMVLATMIPLINSYLTQILSDVSEFGLELSLSEKNTVEFTMVGTNGITKPLYSGSGFEKTVASIALRCALSKICSLPKPNIIIFDEVFGKISNENLEKLSNLFDRLKEFFETIILISHNPMVHEWGDHKIIVTKEDDVSSLK